MIENLISDIYKFEGLSNVYLIKDLNLIIDTGYISDKENLKESLEKIINLNDIKYVIFTHLHYDHISNFDLFKSAKFYTSKKEIDCYKKDLEKTILNKEISKKFNIVLNDIENLEFLKNRFEIIYTPGHTLGSFCLLDKDNLVLFSGDTLFDKNFEVIGRTDLPFSSKEYMSKSLEKLISLDFDILAPGHN